MAINDPIANAHALHQAGRSADAEAACNDLLKRTPEHPDALHLLGILRAKAGDLKAAEQLMTRSLESAPGRGEFHNNLGGVLRDLGRHHDAIYELRRAIELAPSLAPAWNNLGIALEAVGRLGEAKEAYARAVKLRPDDAATQGNFAAMLETMGRPADALAVRRRAVEVCGNAPAGEMAKLHGSALLCMHYSEGDDGPAVFAAHRAWAERHARPLYPPQDAPPLAVDRTPGRKLRVGFVSPDFIAHPVARFFEPLLAAWGRSAFEIYCYSDVRKPDAVTARIRGLSDRWREVFDLSDEQLVARVRADRVDVAVDLCGHMPGNRLLAFARRMAPVQVTAIGYPATTGLETMDWRITDAGHDPPGQTDAWHTERLYRLPGCCWSYQPDPGSPEVTPLPALSAGRVTFAALNRLVKTTPETASLWAAALARVPNSRLLLLVPEAAEFDPSIRTTVDAAMRSAGVDLDRVVAVGRRPRSQYLRLLQCADAALDTFPYAGQTTTCDAMWMGVPTVTLAGRTHVARSGASILPQVGLDKLVAKSPDEYTETAARLAADLHASERLRQELRPRMLRSALMHPPTVTRAWEAALKGVVKNRRADAFSND